MALEIPDRPRIICLIGSSRFKEDFRRIGERLEKAGYLVLMMSFFHHADCRPVSPEEREVLRQVDRFRIDLADEVWVIDGVAYICDNCGNTSPTPSMVTVCDHPKIRRVNYIGEDTQKEVVYAKETGKPLRYLSERFCGSRFNDPGLAV